MRIRLVHKPRKGCIVGVDVDRFEVGMTYDVGTAVGGLFLSEQWAVPVVSDEPAVVIPLSQLAGGTVRRIANEADSAQRRSRTKR